MSIPTSEIPQTRQDAARELIEAQSFGALTSDMQDEVVRRLDRARDSPVATAYQILVGERGRPNRSAFSYFTPAEQTRFLDTLALRPDDALALAFDVSLEDVRDAPLGGARDRAIEVATRPLASRSESDREDRRGMARYYLRDHTERLSALANVVRADGFQSASNADKIRILDVLEACGTTGYEALVAGLLSSVRAPTWSHRAPSTLHLFERDLRNEGTLLDHIHTLSRPTAYLDERVQVGMPYREHDGRTRLAGDPPRRDRRGNRNPPIVRRYAEHYRVSDIGDQLSGASDQIDRAFVVGDLLSEAVLPMSSMNQDNRGTCEATSMLMQLAVFSPAEIGRIGRSLLMSGRALLQDGSELVPPRDAFWVDDSLRSVSERLMQSAVMRYWRGGTVPRHGTDRTDLYRNSWRRRPDLTNPTGSQSDHWLGRYDPARDDRDAERMLTALFGIRHVTVRHGAITRLRAELAARPDRPVIACLDWGVVDRRVSGHCIVITEIRPGPPETIRFWNPWGAPTTVLAAFLGEVHDGRLVAGASGPRWMSMPYGGVGSPGNVQSGRRQPTRTTVSDILGTQSMSMAALRTNIRTIHVPAQ